MTIKNTIKKLTILLAIIFISSTLTAKASTLEVNAQKIAAKSHNLKSSVVKLAIKAFYNSKQLGVSIKKPIITVIDYSLPSTEKRLWVLDLEQNKILYNSMVAHGKHSGENHTTTFSNKTGSLQTSLGVFITKNTYSGKHGHSLKISGLEKGFNDNAESRTIVVHGSPYVNKTWVKNAGRIGRSWGCPAVEPHLAKPIINTIKDGTMIFAYYPDKNWLNHSKFINA